MFFLDSDNQIHLRDSQGAELKIPRPQFLSFEPGYSLPSGIAVRYYHSNEYWISDGSNQQPAKDIPASVIQGYVDKIAQYKSRMPDAVPQLPAIDGDRDWGGLEQSLRGSAAWNRAFSSAGKTLRCNAAFTVLMSSLTVTHNVLDLAFAWSELQVGMQSSSSVSDFSEEELEFVKQALTLNGFNPEQFGLIEPTIQIQPEVDAAPGTVIEPQAD